MWLSMTGTSVDKEAEHYVQYYITASHCFPTAGSEYPKQAHVNNKSGYTLFAVTNTQ